MARALPVGRGYVCEDADDIPRTFAHIFRRASALERVRLTMAALDWRYYTYYGRTSHLSRHARIVEDESF